MENAVGALKIAFAILLFVISLTLLFMAVTQARNTSDVLYYYGDKTNFYKHVLSRGGTGENGDNGNRKVTAPDIVSTMYKYNSELVGVKIILNEKVNGKKIEYIFDLDRKDKQKMREDLTNCINKLGNKEFTEEFVEVPISGIYISTVDGTEIPITADAKKVYVTYRES